MKQHSQSRKIHFHRLQYSLDVLTDGSDHTGHGTVFLTVSSKTNTVPAVKSEPNIDTHPRNYNSQPLYEDVIDSNNIQARYALSGLSSLTSRLCADQNYKVSSLRAVFCSSRLDVKTTSGIPSTLLSLSTYSKTGKLHVVGPEGMDKYMEEMIDIILGRHRVYPSISTCVVPTPTDGNNGDQFLWWKVYEDEYIIVHSRKLLHDSAYDSIKRDHNHHNHDDRVVYIITLKGHEHRVGDKGATEACLKYSFAILPPAVDPKICKNALYPLPECAMPRHHDSHAIDEGSDHMTRTAKPLSFILYIHPRWESNVSTLRLEEKEKLLHPFIRSMSNHHFYTLPNQDGNPDEGLLIRAMDQARILHSHIPFGFPLASKSIDKSSIRATTHISLNQQDVPDTRSNEIHQQRMHHFMQLKSCTSILLDRVHDRAVDDNVKFQMLDRKQCILLKVQHSRATNVEEIDNDSNLKDLAANVRNSWFKMMKDADEKDVLDDKDIIDENEISLESSSTNTSDDESLHDSFPKHEPYSQVKRMKLDTASIQTKLKASNEVKYTIKEGIPRSPHLLVLGTGCASPSPLRGTSGHLLLLPSMHYIAETRLWKRHLSSSVVFECGEGFLHSLSRCIPKHNRKNVDGDMDTGVRYDVSEILLIWISHAHLDHYGDLPLLVHEINRAKMLDQTWCQCWDILGPRSRQQSTSNKFDARHHDGRPRCFRCSHPLPPVVIAPLKVLRFLDCALNCKNGLSLDGPYEYDRKRRMYLGVTNRDFDVSPFAQDIRNTLYRYELYCHDSEIPSHGDIFQPRAYRPVSAIQNIAVDHCPCAYGLLLGLNMNYQQSKEGIPSAILQDFTLCYSGDTRPSKNIVNRCREEELRRGVALSLLIHEATFDSDESGMKQAFKKRHSTVREAKVVANQIGPASCLLTHFSQRYGRATLGLEQENDVATAFDGLLLPLNPNLEKFLPLVSRLATYLMEKSFRLRDDDNAQGYDV